MDNQEAFTQLIDSSIHGNKCFITKELDGEIDLFCLKDRNIEEIHFSPGKIMRIYNIPKGTKKIVINDNLLEEIPNLELRDLVHLEANNNNLKKVNLTDMVNLVSLYLKDNKINKIYGFPTSLKILHIDGNGLKELDLRQADSCVDVVCKRNPELEKIIGGKQMSDPYFRIDKDATAQIVLNGGGGALHGGASLRGGALHGGAPKKTVLTTIVDVKDAVNQYYELKERYEKHKHAVIRKIKNKDWSKQKKIAEVKNAKFKCVVCGEEGGTRFWKDENFLRAICGSRTKPCKLDISILSSLTIPDADIEESLQRVETAKQEIIKLKMDNLFGYIDEKTSVYKFERNIEIIKNQGNMDLYLKNDVNESYYNMQNNVEKTNFISKKMNVVYSGLAEIRRLLEEYEKTGNNILIKEIAMKQVELRDILSLVRSMKYPIHEMVNETVYNFVDDEGNFVDETKASRVEQHVLKQYPYGFDDFLNPNLELLEVKKFQLS